MRIKILASDSMGVRSTCTYIEVNGFSILIDPSCALGPLREGFYPHILEIMNLSEKWEIIKEYLKRADILIFTHYHYDHHNPREIYLYKGKKIFLKDYNDLNKRQKIRGEKFFSLLKEEGIEIEIGDGKFYEKNGVKIYFSKPLPHGRSGKQGYVLGVGIKEGSEGFFYTSDIQGYINNSLKEILYKLTPTIIFMDGPSFYMYSKSERERLCKEMVEKLGDIKKEIEEFRVLILDHHSMRGKDWEDVYSFIKEKLQKLEVEFVCSAEYEGKKITPYEAKRKIIYEIYSAKIKEEQEERIAITKQNRR
ncbi:MAG: hypothetical protein ABIM41_02695 [candidate division WOR-3 bacterium]